GRDSVASARQGKFPAFRENQLREFTAFLASVADEPKPKKLAAIKKFYIEEYRKEMAFRDEMRKAYRGHLTEQPTLFSSSDDHYDIMSKISDFQAKKHAECLEFLDGLLAVPAMVGPALDQAIMEADKARRLALHNFRETTKSEKIITSQGSMLLLIMRRVISRLDFICSCVGGQSPWPPILKISGMTRDAVSDHLSGKAVTDLSAPKSSGQRKKSKKH
ncbi:MAG: hypothetical protein HQM09_15740, partial [Candidatus Riflebacteria bacterium]|nr:hypothetical protein [Candidatus Riflebacteria bacterium]